MTHFILGLGNTAFPSQNNVNPEPPAWLWKENQGQLLFRFLPYLPVVLSYIVAATPCWFPGVCSSLPLCSNMDKSSFSCLHSHSLDRLELQIGQGKNEKYTEGISNIDIFACKAYVSESVTTECSTLQTVWRCAGNHSSREMSSLPGAEPRVPLS